MVNPLAPAYNFFVGLLQTLPSPLMLFILLAGGLFVIATLVRVIFFH